MGSVDDVYFDGDDWDVRYLLVNARRWFPPQVPRFADRDRPRAFRRAEHSRRARAEQISRCPTARKAANLCSSAAVSCDIEATDGGVGSVADLVIDDETWEITDVLVDSRTWLRASCCSFRRKSSNASTGLRRRSTCA